jgi:cytochrome P450
MALHDDSHHALSAVDWSPASHEVVGTVGGGARGVARVDEYARLRASCPVSWTDDWGGYWTLTRYDDIIEATRNEEVLRVGRAFMQIPDNSDISPNIPIGIGPPAHTVYRRALNKYFTPQRMEAIEPGFRDKVNARLNGILDRGSAEAVREFCGPVAAQALAMLLNLPDNAVDDLLSQVREVEALRARAAPGQAADEP